MLKIGITGTNGAGKTTCVEYLASKGFERISLSDLIRQEAQKKGIEPTRRNLQDLGNEMRAASGIGVWAAKALEEMAEDGKYVIDSVRNPGEVEALGRADNFFLIFITAPVEARFLRMRQKSKGFEEELRTLEDFKMSEARELVSKDRANQQLIECAALADFTIVNDSDKGSFFKKIDEFLVKAGKNSI